jgi:ABC-type Mn2+/Zn2+ transport system ATPase subunit
MLHIKECSEDEQASYKEILTKRKDNPEAIYFLKSLDETNDSCFLTGKAGTGKSTLVKDVIGFCKEIDTSPLIL